MSAPRLLWLTLACSLLATGCGDDEPVSPAPGPAPNASTGASSVADAGVVDAGGIMGAVAGGMDGGSALGAPLARLVSVVGDVKLERAGGSGVAAAEGALWRGDALETGADGSATVEVGPEARFVLGEDASGVVLEVARGIVLSRVSAEERDRGEERVSLTLLTPFGLTRLGTEAGEVSLDVGTEESSLDVRLGTVELVSKNGESLKVGGGELVSMTTAKVVRKVLELSPVEVKVKAGHGRVERRRKGGAWRTVRRQGEALKVGDGVRARGGEALLSLEGAGTTLALAEGGELLWGEAVQGRGADETRVTLRRGRLVLGLTLGQMSRLVLPELVLESRSTARLEVTRTGEALVVEARAGDAVLVLGDTRRPLRAGERAVIRGKADMRVVPGEPAPLRLPPGEGHQVFHRAAEEVALTWESQEEGVVEVSADASFSRKLLEGTVRGGFVNVPAPMRGALYWRVRKQDGSEVARGSARFGPERSARALAGPRNVVSEGADKTTIFFQARPPALTFTAAPERKAATWRLAVYREGVLDKPLLEKQASTPRMALEAGAVGEGRFLWALTPVSAEGRPLRGGRMSRLALVHDGNSVPVLVVSSPREGQATAERVRSLGVAPVGVRLTANGQEVPLDGKQRFDIWVAPVGQPPKVVFRMSRPGAPDVFVVRTLR